MAEYVYENASGQWVVCGDFDIGRRELLPQNGFEVVEIIGEPVELPVFDDEPEPEPESDDED